MSVKATTTVSMSPSLIRRRRSCTLRCRSLRSSVMRRFRSHPSSPRSRAAVSSQWFSIVAPRPPGVALEDRVDDLGVLAAGVLDVDRQHGNGDQHVVQVRLDAGDRVDQLGGAGQRRDRQVQPGVGLPVLGRAGRLLDRRVGVGEQRALLLGQRPGGGQVAGTRLDDAAEDQGVHQHRARRGRPAPPPPRPGVTGGWSTTVPPARPRVVRTRLAVRRAAMASRRVARDTPIRTASSRSGGRRAAVGIDAEPDGRGQPLHAVLEGVPAAGGAEDGLAEIQSGAHLSARRAPDPGPWSCARPVRPA